MTAGHTSPLSARPESFALLSAAAAKETDFSQIPTVANSVIAGSCVAADASWLGRTFIPGAGEPILGVTTCSCLLIGGVFGLMGPYPDPNPEVKAPGAPVELPPPADSVETGLNKLFSVMAVVTGLAFVAFRGITFASFFVVSLAVAALILSTVATGLMTGVYAIILLMSLYKLVQLGKLRSTPVKNLNPQLVEKLLGEGVAIPKNEEDRAAFDRQVLWTMVKQIPGILFSMLLVASFPLGFVALGPFFPIILSVILAAGSIAQDGYQFYSSLQGKEKVGRYDVPVLVTQIVLGLASLGGALACCLIFATGIIPLILTVAVGVIWVGLNVALLVKKRRRMAELQQQWRQHLCKKLLDDTGAFVAN